MRIEIELDKLILGDKYWNDICDDFKIPEKDRHESWVIQAIRERIRTYISSYVMRRSIVERENGAALTKHPSPIISDFTSAESRATIPTPQDEEKT